jgi:hypothetical protein
MVANSRFLIGREAVAAVIIIDYENSDVDLLAQAAIECGEPFSLVVRGRNREKLERAASFHRSYFDQKATGRRSLLTWLKFGYYGFSTATFWIIYDRAKLAGMKIDFRETVDLLVVAFDLSPSKVSDEVALTLEPEQNAVACALTPGMASSARVGTPCRYR